MARYRDDRDDGHILVLTGLLLAPLLVFAAFATDVGAWVTQASRLQRTVDAAALAGAAQLPDLGVAESVATEVLARNGYAAGSRYTLTAVGDYDTGLTVTITDTDPPMFFAGLVLNSLNITRSATAVNMPPIRMGSPGNTLGNDPTTGYSPNIFLGIYGPETVKETGDRHHTKLCRRAGEIGCDGSGLSTEYWPDGYLYTVDVAGSSPVGPLRFEILDPIQHEVGDFCQATFLLDPGTATSYSFYRDNYRGLGDFTPERYEQGRTEWCVMDNGRDGTDIKMTVLVRRPDQTPNDPLDNPVVCAVNFGHQRPSNQFDFISRLRSDTTRSIERWEFGGATLQWSPLQLPFRDYFRNWVSVCDIANPVAGEYIIQIRTNADQSAPPASLEDADDTLRTHSRNRYSLRAGFGSDPSQAGWSSGVTLTARDAMVTTVVLDADPSGETLGQFHLARVSPAYAGQPVIVDFFDVSDGRADVAIEIAPPPSFAAGGGALNCTFTKDGAPFPTSDPCKMNERASAGDGLIYQATVNVPSDYDCNMADGLDCWFMLKMTFFGEPNDTATWSVHSPGKPTRLTG